MNEQLKIDWKSLLCLLGQARKCDAKSNELLFKGEDPSCELKKSIKLLKRARLLLPKTNQKAITDIIRLCEEIEANLK